MRTGGRRTVEFGRHFVVEADFALDPLDQRVFVHLWPLGILLSLPVFLRFARSPFPALLSVRARDSTPTAGGGQAWIATAR